MDTVITVTIILSAVIYIIYFFYSVKDSSCGCKSAEKKGKTDCGCGKCHEDSEENKTFY